MHSLEGVGDRVRCHGLTMMRFPCSLEVGHPGDCVRYTYKKYTPMMKIVARLRPTASEPCERALNKMLGLSGL